MIVTKANGNLTATFECRDGTNDIHIAQSAFGNDEYGLRGLGVTEGDIFIDVGAHIGGVAILAAMLGAKVYAVEALPDNHGVMLSNIELNGLEGKIIPYCAAMMGRDYDEMPVWEYPHDEMHRFMGSAYARDNEPEMVRGISLATLFSENGLEHVRILKMDCEGPEYEILQGAPADILERIDYILGEYHPGCYPAPPMDTLFAQTKGLFVNLSKPPLPTGVGPFIFKRVA